MLNYANKGKQLDASDFETFNFLNSFKNSLSTLLLIIELRKIFYYCAERLSLQELIILNVPIVFPQRHYELLNSSTLFANTPELIEIDLNSNLT